MEILVLLVVFRFKLPPVRKSNELFTRPVQAERVLPSLAHYRRKVHSSEKAANPCAPGSIAYAADSSESLDAAIG
ncbi:hypothetical protein CEXT_438991 [Caerostris extrusa]|uniref:Uncharacterized protein n=1 Tax=Caerostris extrusa TaxID=172846 RepID=A0AAV4NYZ9_CAEEX|nr:hypothetical protein CEXT_438991 [Caerostris extrusa]